MLGDGFVELVDAVAVERGHFHDGVLGERVRNLVRLRLLQVALVGHDDDRDVARLEVAKNGDVDLRVRVFRRVHHDQRDVHVLEPLDRLNNSFGRFFRAVLRFRFFQAGFDELAVVHFRRDARHVQKV